MAKKILIIEDDDFLRGMESKKLINNGYDVLVAANSIEAFKILNEPNANEINIILLDLLLPDVDGFTILAKIREDKNLENIPVIIFSNLYQPEDIKKANVLGVSEFLIKSNFTLDELVDKIKNLIG